jgi:hypothetical protein
MLRTLHEEHLFSDMFVRFVVERHNPTQADLVDQMFNSSEKRLARALLILSRVGKEDKSETVTPQVSQQTLAEMEVIPAPFPPSMSIPNRVPESDMFNFEQTDCLLVA